MSSDMGRNAESPCGRSTAMEALPPLTAVGREAFFSVSRKTESASRRSAPLEVATLAAVGREAQLSVPRKIGSPCRRWIPGEAPNIRTVGREGQFPTPTKAEESPVGKSYLVETPALTAMGREMQLPTAPTWSSPPRRGQAISCRDQGSRERRQRVGGVRITETSSHSQTSEETPVTGFLIEGTPTSEFQQCNPWILHFSRDLVKSSSSFDEQFRDQLRTTRPSYKLGKLMGPLVDLGTYTKLSNCSVHDILKLIHQKLQTVKVHRKSCEDLFGQLRHIGDVLSPLFKASETGNTSQGVRRLVVVVKETLADAYVLVKSCESRKPLCSSLLNIPAKIMALEGEIQRMIPVIRAAISQHNSQQDMLGNHSCNMDRFASENGTDDVSSSQTERSSAAPSLQSIGMKGTRLKSAVSDNPNHFSQDSGSTLGMPSRQIPWHLDIHTLTMLKKQYQHYICRACQKVGEGCVFSCDQCNYDVHPGCVELNEAIQRMEEIRITKLSMGDESVEFEKDLTKLSCDLMK